MCDYVYYGKKKRRSNIIECLFFVCQKIKERGVSPRSLPKYMYIGRMKNGKTF